MKSPEVVFSESLTHLMEVAISRGVSPNIVVDRMLPIPDYRSSIPKVYERLLQSVANRNMMSSVIGFSVKKGKNDDLLEERKEVFSEVLKEYDPVNLLRTYKDAGSVFKALKGRPSLHVNSSQNVLWHVFAKGVISGAKFMTEFSDINVFNDFLSQFSSKKELRLALPLYIAKEIDGIGFALACDFLKEIGEVGYPKPDVQLRRVFAKICKYGEKKTSDYSLCKDIIAFVEGLEDSEVSHRIRHMMHNKYSISDFPIHCYSVDKVFWMLGSWKLDRRVPDKALSDKKKLVKKYFELLASIK